MIHESESEKAAKIRQLKEETRQLALTAYKGSHNVELNRELQPLIEKLKELATEIHEERQEFPEGSKKWVDRIYGQIEEFMELMSLAEEANRNDETAA